MAGMAEKPESYFIIPGAALTGEANIVRVSEEAGAYPGTVIPDEANRGLLLPLQSGRVLDPEAQDLRARLLREGGANNAPWIWQLDGAPADEWVGSDDPRYFTRYHCPLLTVPPGSDNCALVYSSAYRRLVAIAVNASVSPSEVTVSYRGVDADYANNVGPWDSVQWSLRSQAETGTSAESIAGDFCNARAVELDDGTLVLVLRIIGVRSFAQTVDYNVYHSSDGGLTWELVADNILQAVFPPGLWESTQNTAVQFALAASGSQLRLTWRVSGVGVEVFDAVSTDRGMTWTGISDGSPITLYDNGDPSTPSSFATVGVDDRGRWLLMALADPGLQSRTSLWYATDSGVWAAVTGSTENEGNNVYGLMLCRANGWIWQFVELADNFLGVADGWTIRRAPASEVGGFGGVTYADAGWQEVTPGIQHNASILVCARPAAVWAGDRFAFLSGNKDVNTGVEINLASYWEGTRGWNERSLGIMGLGANFAEDSDVGGTSTPYAPGAYLPLWWNHWNMRQAAPDAGPYTRTTAGTGAFSYNMNGASLTTTAAGDELTFTLVDSTEPWRGVYTLGAVRHFGATWEWVTAVTAGTPVRGEYGVRITMAGVGFASFCEVEIWIYTDTVEVFDTVGATVRATLNVPGVHTATAGLWRFRVTKVQGPANDQMQIAVRDESDVSAGWVESSVLNLSFTNIASNNEVKWGNWPLAAAGALTTRWAEFSINNRDSLGQIGSKVNAGGASLPGFSNPRDLIGMQALAGEPVEVGNGISVALAGAGGAQGDEYALEVAHTYAAENLLVDSPRIQWRTIAAPVNTLSSPNQFGGSEWSKNIAGGTNTVADNTQTAPDGTLTASRVTYTRATGGAVIFLRAGGGSQSPAATLAPSTRKGWTFSFWMRHSNASSVDFSFDVSDGPGATSPLGPVTVPNDGVWRRYQMNVPRNGLSGATVGGWLDWVIGSYVGGTLLTFDLWGAKLTADPEVVLAVSEDARDADDFDALAVFDCNARKLLVDRSDDADFGASSGVDLLDLRRYPSAGGGLSGFSSVVRAVQFNAGTFPDAAEREAVSEYLYAEDGVRALASYRITRQRDRTAARLFYLDDLPETNALAHFAPFLGTGTGSFVIYGTSGSTLLTNASSGLYRYLRVRIAEQEVPVGESQFRIGSIVTGQRLSLDVPLEWAHTDNEQPNVTSYRTRSAVSWAYREGPPQRTITTRLVGDWNDRQRDRMRAVQRELSYEVRPVVLVVDADRPNEAAMLGRVTSGNQQDQAMWWEDARGVYRTAGDLSLTFVEEV